MAQPYTYRSPTQNNDDNQDKGKELQKEKDAGKAALEFGGLIGESRGATKDAMPLNVQPNQAWPKQESQAAPKDPTPSANAAALDKGAADAKDKAAADAKDKATKDRAAEAAKKQAADAKDAVVSKATEVKDIVVETAIAVKDKAVEAKDKAIEVEQVVADKAIELKDEAVEKLAEAKDVVVETLDDVGERAKRWSRQAWQFTSANAAPLAMIGIGTGLLFANRNRPSSQLIDRRLADPYDRYDELAGEDLYGSGAISSDAQSPSRPKALVKATHPGKRAAARVGPTPRDRSLTPATLPDDQSGLTLQSSEAPRTTIQKIEDSAARGSAFIRRSAEQGTEYVRRTAVRATDATKTFAGNNPLGLAMATLAMGVGIGMMLPSIGSEAKLLRSEREQRDRLVGDARGEAQIPRGTSNDSLDALS